MPKKPGELIQVFGKPGTQVIIGNQTYTLSRIEPYPPTGNIVAYWTANCRTCNAPFEVFAHPGRIDFSRNCPNHKKSQNQRLRPTRTPSQLFVHSAAQNPSKSAN